MALRDNPNLAKSIIGGENDLQLRKGVCTHFHLITVEDRHFLTENKWLDIHGVHPVEYYMKLFKDFFKYLISVLDFISKEESVFCVCTDRNIPFMEDKDWQKF